MCIRDSVAAILAVELSIREYIRAVVKESYAVFNQHSLGLYLIYHRVLKGIHLQSLLKEMFNKANGRSSISITSCKCFLKHRIINKFHLNEDLLGAICTSSQIPFMLSPSFFYNFRGERCLDGGLNTQLAKNRWRHHNDITISMEQDEIFLRADRRFVFLGAELLSLGAKRIRRCESKRRLFL